VATPNRPPDEIGAFPRRATTLTLLWLLVCQMEKSGFFYQLRSSDRSGWFALGGMPGVGWRGENGPLLSSSELRQPEPGIPVRESGLRPVLGTLGTRAEGRDVIGNVSSTAWYAAVRGLPRCRDLSNRSFVHHSTLSHSMHGSSISLAKYILSQNVRRVRVCKRHLPSARDRKGPDAADAADHGGRAG
jgi:hypothetical protein